MDGLNMGIIKALPVVLPPISAQEKLALTAGVRWMRPVSG